MENAKVKVGIFEFTGCAGDALLILDCEKELIDIFNAVDIQSFVMANSANSESPVDIAFVEGSITTEKEIHEIQTIRKKAKIVVAIGLCATAGGIQGRCRQNSLWESDYKAIYGDIKMIHTQPIQSKPIDAYIEVDYYLPGCPIGKEQFLNFFTRMINGHPPEKYPQPVCKACKQNENICLLKAGRLCLGPLTADGCGSICPNHNLPCVGCWGPLENANFTSEFYLLKEYGFSHEHILGKMKNFSGGKIQSFIETIEKEKP